MIRRVCGLTVKTKTQKLDFRPNCLQAVHEMQPTATDDAINRDAILGVDSGGSNEPGIRWGPDPPTGRSTLRWNMYQHIKRHKCIAPAMGECSCSAHAAHKCICHRDKTRRLLPNYFKHFVLDWNKSLS